MKFAVDDLGWLVLALLLALAGWLMVRSVALSNVRDSSGYSEH
jgi:uncharacterized membrane protein